MWELLLPRASVFDLEIRESGFSGSSVREVASGEISVSGETCAITVRGGPPCTGRAEKVEPQGVTLPWRRSLSLHSTS